MAVTFCLILERKERNALKYPFQETYKLYSVSKNLYLSTLATLYNSYTDCYDTHQNLLNELDTWLH
jgi:hypothetical protein